MGIERMHEIRSSRPEASAAVWDWRADEGAGQVTSTRPIRIRGALRAGVGAIAGALVWFYLSPLIGRVMLALSLVLFLVAMLSPTGAYALLERAFAALANVVGRLLNGLVLPILFYGIFTPMGALLRPGKRDALQRFFEPERATYWSDRKGPRTASAHRTRQY
jgi:hypothetical protein